MGRDLGYLPGDAQEKLAPWMQPIFDNLTYLMSSRGVGSQHAYSNPAEQRIQNMIHTGQLVLEPLTYIRGRSIPNQFIIVAPAAETIVAGPAFDPVVSVLAFDPVPA